MLKLSITIQNNRDMNYSRVIIIKVEFNIVSCEMHNGHIVMGSVRCTLVYYTGWSWSLLHVSYSDVISTKLHLRLSEPASFETMYGATLI